MRDGQSNHCIKREVLKSEPLKPVEKLKDKNPALSAGVHMCCTQHKYPGALNFLNQDPTKLSNNLAEGVKPLGHPFQGNVHIDVSCERLGISLVVPHEHIGHVMVY